MKDEAAMRAYGEQLGASLRAGDWVAINGPLGAGKTVLCGGILRGLGFGGEVNSPSYALIHRYDPPDVVIPVSHADLYRLHDVGELEELGLADDGSDAIILVEWAERAGDGYGDPTHKIEISKIADGQRKLEVTIKNDR